MAVFPLAALLVAAAPPPGLATPGRPAVLHPVVEAAARCSANPQVVVALTGFTPPREGHATLVVSAQAAGGRRIELGRVGVFPEQAFAAPLANAMRFGFALPKSALARAPAIQVEVVADGGSGAGMRALIGEARIVPPPQEHC